MAKIKTPSITVTVTLSGKTLDRLAESLIEPLIDDFDDEAFDAADIDAALLVQDVSMDKKFLVLVDKAVKELIDEREDQLMDQIAFAELPLLNKVTKALEKAAAKLDSTYDEREQDRRIKEAMQFLKGLGYDVSK